MGKLSLFVKQQRKINTLELEIDTLKNVIKEKLYDKFMENVENELEIKRLKKENKNLRINNKKLKAMVNKNV